MTPTLEERLGVGMDTIREFCETWGIIELALFGSVVRDDFGPESDIDVMVRFDLRVTTPLPTLSNSRRT